MSDTNECPTCHRPKTIWPKEKCAVEGVCTFCHGNCAPPRKITSDELLAAIPAPPAAEAQTTGKPLIGPIGLLYRTEFCEHDDPHYLAADVDRRWAEREADRARVVAEKDIALRAAIAAEATLRLLVANLHAENAQLRDRIELLHGTTPSLADGVIEMRRMEIDTLLKACGEKDATINDLCKRLEQRAAEIARLTQKVTMQRSQIKGIHQARKNERRPAD